MSFENPVQLLQKSFHVALGATASLVEALQDSEKRHENLSKLNQEWSVLSAEWAQKGELTEQEARNFVDSLMSQGSSQSTQTPGAPGSRPSTPTAPPDVQLELQELTAQITALRAELETLRNQNTPS